MLWNIVEQHVVALTILVKAYFHDLQFCVTAQRIATIEIGIIIGCTVSPLAFTMVSEHQTPVG